MRIYRLPKIVLRLKNNAAQFLNGLTSNKMEELHNAFLNLHGRIIATFDQLKISDEEVLMVMEAPFVEKVLEHIERYVKLAGVSIKKEDYNVYFDLEDDVPASQEDYVIPQKKGRLVITQNNLSSNVSEKEFRVFRLKNNIPLHGIDYQDELLLNVSTTDFVSFTKGCYLGQEPISKVYNRSKPSWKLVVKYLDECCDEEKEKMTSKITDPDTGREFGFIFVSNQD